MSHVYDLHKFVMLNRHKIQFNNSTPNQENNSDQEQILNQVPEQILNQVPEQILNQVPEQILNQVPEQILNQASEQFLDQAPNQYLLKPNIQELIDKYNTNTDTNIKSNESELILIGRNWYIDYDSICKKILRNRYGYKKIVSNWSGNCIGIKSDNTLIFLGAENSYPMHWTNEKFIDIACGVSHFVGLRADGTIYTCGQTPICKRNEPTWISEKDHIVTFKPYLLKSIFGPDLQENILVGHPSNKFVSIACGDAHSVGIRVDGSVAIWGDDYNSVKLNAPSLHEKFTQIACSKFATIGLKSDGQIYSWGLNSSIPTICSGKKFKSIAAGEWCMGAITCEGQAITWLCLSEGSSLFDNYISDPSDFSLTNPFVKLICGKNYFIGIKENGTLSTWGNPGQDKCNFIGLPSDKSFNQVITSHFGSVGIKTDGSICTWGRCPSILPSLKHKKFTSMCGINEFFVGLTSV